MRAFNILRRAAQSVFSTRSDRSTCQIEGMEPRSLMSATDPISIVGTDGPDYVELHYVDYHDGNTAFVWTLNGVTHHNFNANPQYILINTLGDNDVVKVTSTVPNQELRIVTGDGDDNISFGDYNTTGFDFNHFGNVSLDMGSGKDWMNIYNHASNTPGVNDAYDFFGQELYVRGTSATTNKPITGCHLAFKSANIIKWYGQQENTKWNINSVYIGTDLTCFGGDGSDDFRVGDGNIDMHILGNVQLNGGYGTDGTTFVDYDNFNSSNYRLTYNHLYKTAGQNTNMTFYTENVFLYATNGHNTIQVENVDHYQHFYIFGDGGNDFISIPSANFASLNGAKINVTGGPGINTLNIVENDLKKQPASYEITENSVIKYGASVIQYAGFKKFNFTMTGSGKDVLYVSPSRYTEYLIEDWTIANDQIIMNLYGAKNPAYTDQGSLWAMYTFANRKSIQTHNFTNIPKVFQSNTQITGQVFNDYNLDGIKNNGDAGIAGRMVYLDLNNNGKFDLGDESAVTDANGNFSFDGFAPSWYVLREVLPAGWNQTTPKNDYGILVKLGGNQKVSGNLFGTKHW